MKSRPYNIRFTAILSAALAAATVQAEDYTYSTNAGTITITGYTGSGGDAIIPSTIDGLPVTGIGESAFFDQYSLTSVTIPNSVTSIGTYAFASCSSLTNVTIPDSVTDIGDGAFEMCTRLTGATTGNSVTSIAPGMFAGCTRLTNVAIGSSVTMIGASAFQYCTNLVGITIPDGVTSIGNLAFESCFRLSNIAIPNSVSSIGEGALSSCISLTNVIIPDRVTEISGGTFSFCTSLTSIAIPSSVSTIGDWAFSGCTSLTNVTVPGSVVWMGSAFASCSNLTGVYFQGDAPDSTSDVFHLANSVIVYYLSGTAGWGLTFGGRPTAALLGSVPAAVSPSYPASTNAVRPELALSSAFDGANFCIGIRGDAGSPDAVGGQPLSPSGTNMGLLISTGRSMEGFLDGPRVAFGGSNYLMVWTDAATNHSESGSDIYAHFVNPGGSLAGNAFPVSQAAGGQYARGAAYDGTNFLVIWAGAEGLRGRRVSAAGQLLDAELVFTTAEVEEAAAVAHGGGQYLVVWVDDSGGDYATRGRFVSTSGQLGSVLQLSQTNSPSYNPLSVAYGQGRFMVVWHHKTDVDADWNLRGRIVLPDGSTAGNELTLTGGPKEDIAWANNVVFDGQHFLVVWTAYAGSPTYGSGTVLGRYWSAGGEPVGATFTIEPAGTGTLAMGLSAGNGKALTVINRNAFTSASDVWVRLITRPFVEVSAVGPQKIRVAFNGVLQYSTNLQAWIDYTPQPRSPWTNQTGNGAGFFRARVDGQAPGF